MKFIQLSVLLSLVIVCSFGCIGSRSFALASESERAASVSNFDRIKALTGDWYLVGGNRLGKELAPDLTKPFLSYEISSGGHSVIEKLFVSTPKEMTTVYYLSNGHLMMDHYCSLGNQPRMVANPSAEDEIAFRLVDVGNMANPDDLHISSHALEFRASGELVAHWGATRDQKAVSGSIYRVKQR